MAPAARNDEVSTISNGSRSSSTNKHNLHIPNISNLNQNSTRLPGITPPLFTPGGRRLPTLGLSPSGPLSNPGTPGLWNSLLNVTNSHDTNSGHSQSHHPSHHPSHHHGPSNLIPSFNHSTGKKSGLTPNESNLRSGLTPGGLNHPSGFPFGNQVPGLTTPSALLNSPMTPGLSSLLGMGNNHNHNHNSTNHNQTPGQPDIFNYPLPPPGVSSSNTNLPPPAPPNSQAVHHPLHAASTASQPPAPPAAQAPAPPNASNTATNAAPNAATTAPAPVPAPVPASSTASGAIAAPTAAPVSNDLAPALIKAAPAPPASATDNQKQVDAPSLANSNSTTSTTSSDTIPTKSKTTKPSAKSTPDTNAINGKRRKSSTTQEKSKKAKIQIKKEDSAAEPSIPLHAQSSTNTIDTHIASSVSSSSASPPNMDVTPTTAVINSRKTSGTKKETRPDNQDISTTKSLSSGGRKPKGNAEEKRKNFLERNRVAASKCRQRKKQLLQKMEDELTFYSTGYRELSAHVTQLREQLLNVRGVLVGHKDCSVLISAVGGFDQLNNIIRQTDYVAHMTSGSQNSITSIPSTIPTTLNNGVSPDTSNNSNPENYSNHSVPTQMTFARDNTAPSSENIPTNGSMNFHQPNPPHSHLPNPASQQAMPQTSLVSHHSLLDLPAAAAAANNNNNGNNNNATTGPHPNRVSIDNPNQLRAIHSMSNIAAMNSVNQPPHHQNFDHRRQLSNLPENASSSNFNLRAVNSMIDLQHHHNSGNNDANTNLPQALSNQFGLS